MKNLFLLPTDKPSRFVTSKNKKTYYLISIEEFKDIDKFIEYDSKSWDSQNIYITNDEEIKEGDWVLDTLTKKITKNKGFLKGVSDEKIILTTDQDLVKDGVQAIFDDFLEWFVKNPSCEEVEVLDVRYDISTLTNDIKKYPNLDVPDYKIVIPKEEKYYTALLQQVGTKQETPKEIAERYYEDEVSINAFINGYKLAQEQFKNK